MHTPSPMVATASTLTPSAPSVRIDVSADVQPDNCDRCPSRGPQGLAALGAPLGHLLAPERSEAAVNFPRGSDPAIPVPAAARRGSERAAKRARPRPPLAPGMRAGAWKVEGELGAGGMAQVYAVVHQGFGKRAALKLAHRSILGPQFTPETFLREARIVHLVNHPCVTDVFAIGTYDGRPYLVMELLHGQTLGSRVAAGAIDRTLAFDVLLELCDVLGAAHAAGVIHRDLKLDNVFVLDRPYAGGHRIKLLDWGVATIADEPDPLAGMIAGTLTYVAPEQVRGDALTPAADVYSLGVLAYQLLLGQPPFAARSDLELIKQHLHAPPPSPSRRWPEIPDALAELLVAMLAKHAAERPTLPEVARVLTASRARRDKPTDPIGRPIVEVPLSLRRALVAVGGFAIGAAAMAACL